MKKIHGDTKEQDSRAMHVDGDSFRVCRRKSRCRIGLERDRGKHSGRERPEPIRPSTIRSDRTTRCIRIGERHHRRVSSLSRNDRSTARSIPRRSSNPGCVSRAQHLFSSQRARHSTRTSRARWRSIPDGQAKTDGIATGEAAALAMIALRANDGSSPPQFKTPGPPVPGEWQATPSCPIVNGVAVGIAFQWQNVTPFGIPSASGVSPRSATSAHEPPIRESLQRGDDGRKHRQYRATTRSR